MIESLCGSVAISRYLLTVSKVDRYPIQKIEDMFAKLTGGKVFSKLDLSQTSQQIRLDEESPKLVVINTHQGLFQYRGLSFRVASVPEIFQRVMECFLNEISGVTIYLDDILMTGKSKEDHSKKFSGE